MVSTTVKRQGLSPLFKITIVLLFIILTSQRQFFDANSLNIQQTETIQQRFISLTQIQQKLKKQYSYQIEKQIMIKLLRVLPNIKVSSIYKEKEIIIRIDEKLFSLTAQELVKGMLDYLGKEEKLFRLIKIRAKQLTEKDILVKQVKEYQNKQNTKEQLQSQNNQQKNEENKDKFQASHLFQKAKKYWKNMFSKNQTVQENQTASTSQTLDINTQALVAGAAIIGAAVGALLLSGSNQQV